MTEVKNPEPSVFIQFAGQGVKYMEDLRRLYETNVDIRPFIQDAISEIRKQKSYYDDSQTNFFSFGLDVDQWIAYPEKTPDLGYLLSSPISHPLIYLAQISEYIAILQQGVDQKLLLGHTHSVTGFSTGIVAAILVSMGLGLNDLWHMAIKVQAMFFWQGIRTQQSMLTFGVNPKLDGELYNSPEGCPSAMASINNLTRGRLDKAIELFSGEGAIYVAYELFPGRFIVSGLPHHLERFHAFLKTQGNDVAWRYIPSTIGAHSPFLGPSLGWSPTDADILGVRFNGPDMKLPVWSNDTGDDLRKFPNIMHEVIRAYYISTGVWRKQIHPLLPPTRIKYVLDFGPGTGVASLTENHTSRVGIKIIRCTLPIGKKQLLEEVMPSLAG
ncbi:MAG: hypothetical protein KJ737_08915 [Proteobacteria bacterium]|nr:hypothetical protein [Pseudomonadota bacterium]